MVTRTSRRRTGIRISAKEEYVIGPLMALVLSAAPGPQLPVCNPDLEGMPCGQASRHCTFWCNDDNSLLICWCPPPPPPTVSVSVTGTGSVTSSPPGINCPSASCTMSVSYGTSVSLTARPATGYVFGGWSGACSGSGTCTLTVNSNQSVTAQFNPQSIYMVSVAVIGTGSVTSSPAGINCPSGSCTMSGASGRALLSRPTPEPVTPSPGGAMPVAVPAPAA
jgi:uncharacterized repeat protein (TIGR02543 family)